MNVMTCVLCGNPWGIIGPDTPENRAELADKVAEWFGDRWAWALQDLDQPRRSLVAYPFHGPPPLFETEIEVTSVVWVSEASAAWLSESIGWDELVEPPCWQLADHLPEWWARSRAKPALCLVDCCGLGRLADRVLRAAGIEGER